METTEFKSSLFYQWFTPIFAGLSGVFFSATAVLFIKHPFAQWWLLFIVAWGAYNLIFAIRTWGAFKAITVDSGGVTIGRGPSGIKVPWSDVTSSSRVIWGPLFRSSPTIHSLTFKRPRMTVYFVQPTARLTGEYSSMAHFIEVHRIRFSTESARAV